MRIKKTISKKKETEHRSVSFKIKPFAYLISHSDVPAALE
jgi:hypothetical protein